MVDNRKKKSKLSNNAMQKRQRIAKGPRAVASIIGRITRPILGKRGFAHDHIITHWKDIVGEKLARFSYPIKVAHVRGVAAGTLHLRVANGAAAATIHPQIPIILDRINQFIGYTAVQNITVSQGPVRVPSQRRRSPMKPLTPAQIAIVQRRVETVQLPDLQTALARLGEAVMRKQTNSTNSK